MPVVAVAPDANPKGKGKGKWKGKGKSQPSVPSSPLLGIASVRIPHEHVVKIGGVTQFTIELYPENGRAPWAVQHRYNHFRDLADQLHRQGTCRWLSPFPKKHCFSCIGTRAKIESRRAGLEVWLTQVINASSGNDLAAWRIPLRIFLQADAAQTLDAGLPTGPAAQAAIPMTIESTSAPLLQSSAPAGASSSQAAAPAEMVEVEVPAGVAPGQNLCITVPSGEQIVVVIPQNVEAGHTLRLWYEDGALQVLS